MQLAEERATYLEAPHMVNCACMCVLHTPSYPIAASLYGGL